MADLDNLIDELFPGSDGAGKLTKPPKDKKKMASQGDWDADSDNADNANVDCSDVPPPLHQAPSGAGSQRTSAARQNGTHAVKSSSDLSSSSTSTSSGTNAARKNKQSDTAVKKKRPGNMVRGKTDFGNDDSDSDGGVDEKVHRIHKTKHPANTLSPTTAARHSFDDDSDCDEADRTTTQTQSSGTGRRLTDASARPNRANASDEALERPSTAQRVLFTVPFPSAPHSDTVGPPCPNRCVVSTLGYETTHHPTVPVLRQVANGAFDTVCDKKTMLLKKGAFYVHNPRLGNAVLDNRGDPSELGGCPNIFCLKCHHTVVRLQGAQWCDYDGDEADLYLTTRNYYPDWSRLATSNVVGGKNDEESCLALKANSETAAYCCQCSWLTVKAEKALIETSLTAAVTYKHSEQARPFATVLPRREGDERRPPLWVCKGHPL